MPFSKSTAQKTGGYVTERFLMVTYLKLLEVGSLFTEVGLVF